MIQANMTGTRADAHRQDLFRSAETHRRARFATRDDRRMAATHRSASGIPVSGGRAVSRTPVSARLGAWLISAGRDSAERRCKPPERTRARRPGSPVLQSLNRIGAGSTRVAPCLSNATFFSSRWTSGAGTACQPSATRWSRRQRSMRSRSGACSSPTTGPTRRRAAHRVPACTPGPISTRTGRC